MILLGPRTLLEMGSFSVDRMDSVQRLTTDNQNVSVQTKVSNTQRHKKIGEENRVTGSTAPSRYDLNVAVQQKNIRHCIRLLPFYLKKKERGSITASASSKSSRRAP